MCTNIYGNIDVYTNDVVGQDEGSNDVCNRDELVSNVFFLLLEYLWDADKEFYDY